MKIKFEDVKNNETIRVYIEKADRTLMGMGFTEHSFAHVTHVASVAGKILKDLDYPKHDIEIARIAGYMHDIGIGYGSINHPVDRDPLCGYNGIIDDTCPCCHRGETTRVTERIKRIKVD